MYEIFDHTADLGLRVMGGTLEGVFVEAGEALFSVIVDDIRSVRPSRQVEIDLQNDDQELLLFDWLNELLYRFETGHLLFSRFETRISGGSLAGKAWGEPLDLARHALVHEVKAITYHGLKLRKQADHWLAEVVVDI
jgi:SHS2 domain-containing protein